MLIALLAAAATPSPERATSSAAWLTEGAQQLLVSVIVFAVGYAIVYRKQLRHLNTQVQDRDAKLNAAQAWAALEIGKAVEVWYAEAIHVFERPFSPWRLPHAHEADDRARLANDKRLAELLIAYSEQIRVVGDKTPDFLYNVRVFTINGNEEAKAAVGSVKQDGLELLLTDEQREYLKPAEHQWRVQRAEWGRLADEFYKTGCELRERAEYLLRQVGADEPPAL